MYDQVTGVSSVGKARSDRYAITLSLRLRLWRLTRKIQVPVLTIHYTERTMGSSGLKGPMKTAQLEFRVIYTQDMTSFWGNKRAFVASVILAVFLLFGEWLSICPFSVLWLKCQSMGNSSFERSSTFPAVGPRICSGISLSCVSTGSCFTRCVILFFHGTPPPVPSFLSFVPGCHQPVRLYVTHCFLPLHTHALPMTPILNSGLHRSLLHAAP